MAYSDVIIIGAGIQGLSAAYHLATQGVSGVTVIDSEDQVGAGSSARSAAMLMLQRETAPKIRLSQYSYSRYMAFADEFETSLQFRKTGFLSVVSRPKLEHARKLVALRREHGVETHVLSPTQISECVPQVNVSDLDIGVLGPDDGVLDPAVVVNAYAARARKLGVNISLSTAATGLTIKGDRVIGVNTTNGSLLADIIVNAAGADAARIALWAGVTLPIDSRKRSIFVADNTPGYPHDLPMVEDAEYEWYFRPEGSGLLMGMGKENSTSISSEPSWDYLPTALAFAMHRAPLVADANFTRGWSGLRALTPDLNPIIGPVEGLEGFILSCGWGGEGIMHAPAGGALIANCVTGVYNQHLDPGPFELKRFNGVSST